MSDRLLTLQLEHLESIVTIPILAEQTVAVGNAFIHNIKSRLKQLRTLIDIEKHLQSTQPADGLPKLQPQGEKEINKAINQVLTGPTRIMFSNSANDKNRTLKNIPFQKLADFR